jgi:monoamine oxidase
VFERMSREPIQRYAGPAQQPQSMRLTGGVASHAKFFALYDRSFWLEAGYSGTAESMVGPMAEIHDATTRSGHAALFGFLGVGAAERSGSASRSSSRRASRSSGELRERDT